MNKVSNTYINGQFIENNSNLYFELFNPANEEQYGTLLCSTTKDLRKAINSAYINQRNCSDLSILNRKNILLQVLQGINDRKQELAEIISLEMGAPNKFV
jgi:aldehyde dehydrogenase (NAD+)